MYTLRYDERDSVKLKGPPSVGGGTHGVPPAPSSAHLPMMTPDKRAVRCHVPGCGQCFADAKALATHKAEAHRSLRCPASGCHLSFNSETALQTHMRTKHQRNTCSFPGCCQQFRSEMQLKEHVERKHSRPCTPVFNPVQANNYSFEMQECLMPDITRARQRAKTAAAGS